MSAAESAAARVAAALAGRPSLRTFRAPGRVNLMGDHTDYNEGFVLPIAIELECVASGAPGGDRVRLRSLDLPADVDVAADGSNEPASVEPSWGRYVAGVVRALARRGREPVGFEGVLASSVPAGSGLSSSAALELAVALALADAGGLVLTPRELALACQEAERSARGVPSGVMDQMASAAGREGHALLLDCRTLDVEHVPVDAALGFVVVHSGLPRSLERTAYTERADATRDLAATLGLRSLRDATAADVADDPLGRHVVSENERVHEARDALADGDGARLGAIFEASHASLRDDYRVSTPELDALVRALVAAGAHGARLTGAGFGGAVVAVCAAGAEEEIAERAEAAYRDKTGHEPVSWLVHASSGAGRVGP